MSDQPETPTKTVKITLRIPEGMQDKFKEIAKRRGPRTRQIDLWQQAARKFIDAEEDVIGSKAHFHHSMRERLQDLEDDLAKQIAQIPDEAAAKLAKRLEAVEDDMYTMRRLVEALLIIEGVHWARIVKKNATGEDINDLIHNAINAADEGKFNLSKILRWRDEG